MKKLLAIFALATCCGMMNAHALNPTYPIADRCLNSCTTTITTDSGSTGKSCNANPRSSCDCLLATPTGVIQIATSCSSPYVFFANTAKGKKCCYNPYGLTADESSDQQNVESIEGTESESGLEEVFTEEPVNPLAEEYFAYVNTVLRSPNAGRTVSATARLDACLYYTDVDAMPGSTNYDKWLNCKGSTYGCDAGGKNEYCQATSSNDGSSVSAGVCKDRCDCVYGYGTCQNY